MNLINCRDTERFQSTEKLVHLVFGIRYGFFVGYEFFLNVFLEEMYRDYLTIFKYFTHKYIYFNLLMSNGYHFPKK